MGVYTMFPCKIIFTARILLSIEELFRVNIW